MFQALGGPVFLRFSAPPGFCNSSDIRVLQGASGDSGLKYRAFPDLGIWGFSVQDLGFQGLGDVCGFDELCYWVRVQGPTPRCGRGSLYGFLGF